MIIAIKLRLQLIPIANKPRKIHDVIKRPALQNPLIHPRPCPLPLRIRVRLPVPRERRDRRPDGSQPGLFAVGYDLLVRGDKPVADALLGARVGTTAADIVYAFEDENAGDALLGEGVAGVADQECGAEAAAEDCVAAGCLVCDGEVCDPLFLQACKEEVRPAGVIFS